MKASKSPLRENIYISTSLAPLDELMGGGIRMRRITQFSGDHSTGKTTISYMVAANAQRIGYKVKWFDTEKRFEYDFAEALGVDLDKLDFDYTSIAEEVFKKSIEWVQEKDRVFILDSIGGLHTRKEAEAGMQVGFPETPKLIPAYVRALVIQLALNNGGALMLNHEKKEFMTEKIKVLGGTAIPYHASTWVRFRRTPRKILEGTGDKQREIGCYIEASISKGRNFHQKTHLYQKSTGGFDLDAYLLEEAIYEKIITKPDGGTSYYLGEEKIAVGQAKAREWATENKDKLKELLSV